MIEALFFEHDRSQQRVQRVVAWQCGMPNHDEPVVVWFDEDRMQVASVVFDCSVNGRAKTEGMSWKLEFQAA